MQSLHRHRSRLVGNSTQLINQMRGFLLERGISAPQGKRKLVARLPEILEDADNGLPLAMRDMLAGMLEEWEELDGKIAALNRQLVTESKADAGCERLLEIPGVGAQTATAVVAAIGDGQAFDTGRDFAAWLGLTPRESSTGGKQRLGHISKQGNRYIRTLLTQLCAIRDGDAVEAYGCAGRVAAAHAGKERPPGSDRRAGARLARVIWAVLRKGERFQPQAQAAAAA